MGVSLCVIFSPLSARGERALAEHVAPRLFVERLFFEPADHK